MTWTVALSNLVLGVYGFTLITGLPANILAFYAFCQKIRKKTTPMDILLLSLTISDLIFLFFLPFRMVEAANMEWTLSYSICLLTGFVYFSTIYNSVLHLTAISVERYLGVAFPIKYKIKRNPRHAAIAVVFFWVISFVTCSIVYITYYRYPPEPDFIDPSDRNTCQEEFTVEKVRITETFPQIVFIVLLCASFLICCFCYVKFIYILSNLPNMKTQIRTRAIGLALVTLLVFIICFMPFGISHFVSYSVSSDSTERNMYVLVPCTLNACLDPFIFYFSSSAFRETFKSVLRELIRRMAMLCCHSASSVCCLKVGQQRREHRDHIPMT
ncbi:free fatty acid receptor 2-like [Misgurnus anguillicaudatus]|uniref:free fatty acid receptor 2-like n=1 Tax=Misgurnus anguillicaudatus TaxID=75329 RepID=UPI003CCEFF26